MDEDFAQLQDKFGKQNCMHFEVSEENKLVYTDIFKKWQDFVEEYV